MVRKLFFFLFVFSLFLSEAIGQEEHSPLAILLEFKDRDPITTGTRIAKPEIIANGIPTMLTRRENFRTRRAIAPKPDVATKKKTTTLWRIERSSLLPIVAGVKVTGNHEDGFSFEIFPVDSTPVGLGLTSLDTIAGGGGNDGPTVLHRIELEEKEKPV